MNRSGQENAALTRGIVPSARLSLPSSAEHQAEFHAQWLQVLCEQVNGAVVGLLVHRQDGTNTFVTSAFWPAQPGDLGPLAEVSRHCLAENRDIVVPAMVRGERPGMTATRIGVPFRDNEGAPFAAMALEIVAPQGARIDSDEALRQIAWAGAWLLAAQVANAPTPAAAEAGGALAALDLVALCGEHEHIGAAGLALANELATTWNCSRVSIGFDRGARLRLAAISFSSGFDARSQFAEAIENAMNEAFYQGASVLLPPVPEAPATISLAARDLLRRSGSSSVLTVVLRGRKAPVGAMTFERGPEAAFTAADEVRLAALAAVLGPVLELLIEHEHWLAGRPRRLLLTAREALMRPDRPLRRVALVAALLLPLLLAIIPGTLRISAKSVLEGRVQRVLVAPFDGFVGQAQARAGDVVRGGQVLAQMEDRDLALDRARAQSEMQTLAAKYSDALALHDRPQIMILGAQVREAQAALALAEEKLARTRITAPFDGVVVSGDLSQSLGSPIERGKPLFEVAPLDGFRVIVQVDERDIRFVKPGQHGRIVLSGLPSQALPLSVTRTTAVATANEGRNYFRTEAALAKGDPRLRPGMEGVAQIEAGTHPLLWIWTRTLVDWLRVFFWKWLP